MARVSDIITIASRLTGVSEAAIRGPNRKRDVMAVRFAVYAVSREFGFSYPDIGFYVGGRDHSSVTNGIRKIPTYAVMFPNLGGLLQAMRHYAEACDPFLADSDWKPAVGIDMTARAMSDAVAVKAAATERNRVRRKIKREQARAEISAVQPVKPKLDAIERADNEHRMMMMRGCTRLREALAA